MDNAMRRRGAIISNMALTVKIPTNALIRMVRAPFIEITPLCAQDSTSPNLTSPYKGEESQGKFTSQKDQELLRLPEPVCNWVHVYQTVNIANSFNTSSQPFVPTLDSGEIGRDTVVVSHIPFTSCPSTL